MEYAIIYDIPSKENPDFTETRRVDVKDETNRDAIIDMLKRAGLDDLNIMVCEKHSK